MSGHLYPDSILYTHEHVWLREEPNGIATVGITDFAQDQLGEIAFVDLPAVGAAFSDGDEFGTVESIKSVNALYMPVSGAVLAVNEELSATPTQVNMEPYGCGWMLRILVNKDAARDGLVSAGEYEARLR